MASLVHSPLDFLANVAAEERNALQRQFTAKSTTATTTITTSSSSSSSNPKGTCSNAKDVNTAADPAAASTTAPSTYLKSLFQKHCPHVQLPLRCNKDDLESPSQEDTDSYCMEVCRAVRTCNVDKVRELHQAGHNLNACNKFGESLIHMACRRGDLKMVRYLIREAKVRVDVRDDFGRNIGHDATWTPSPRFEVMDELLKVVPPEYWVMEDTRGHTPFEYARKEHWGDWLEYLKKNEDLIVRKLAFVPY